MEATFVKAWASDKLHSFSVIKYKDVFECPGKRREDIGKQHIVSILRIFLNKWSD